MLRKRRQSRKRSKSFSPTQFLLKEEQQDKANLNQFPQKLKQNRLESLEKVWELPLHLRIRLHQKSHRLWRNPWRRLRPKKHQFNSSLNQRKESPGELSNQIDLLPQLRVLLARSRNLQTFQRAFHHQDFPKRIKWWEDHLEQDIKLNAPMPTSSKLLAHEGQPEAKTRIHWILQRLMLILSSWQAREKLKKLDMLKTTLMEKKNWHRLLRKRKKRWLQLSQSLRRLRFLMMFN